MTDLNLQLFHWINLGPTSPALWVGLALLSSTVLPAALLVGLGGALCWRDAAWRRNLWCAVLAMLIAWAVARGLSALWPTPRPFAMGLGYQLLEHKPTPSFPSSHASVAFALGSVLWWQASQPLARWLPLLLAALVAWSRVALGVHFPFDGLAGAWVGCASGMLALSIVGRRRRAVPASVAAGPLD